MKLRDVPEEGKKIIIIRGLEGKSDEERLKEVGRGLDPMICKITSSP